jgi:hypothetical protein
VIIPSVNYLFSSQWLPPKSHDIWHDHGLEFVFSSVKSPRCNIYLDLKSTPFGVNHDEVYGSSIMERVFYMFSKGGKQLQTAVDQHTARHVSWAKSAGHCKLLMSWV